MPDPIRAEWIEAVAEALHADNCPSDVDSDEPCDCGGWGREAEVALAAVLPLVREQVARVRADERANAPRHSTGTDTGGPCCECCYDVNRLRAERDRLRAEVADLSARWHMARGIQA